MYVSPKSTKPPKTASRSVSAEGGGEIDTLPGTRSSLVICECELSSVDLPADEGRFRSLDFFEIREIAQFVMRFVDEARSSTGPFSGPLDASCSDKADKRAECSVFTEMDGSLFLLSNPKA